MGCGPEHQGFKCGASVNQQEDLCDFLGLSLPLLSSGDGNSTHPLGRTESTRSPAWHRVSPQQMLTILSSGEKFWVEQEQQPGTILLHSHSPLISAIHIKKQLDFRDDLFDLIQVTAQSWALEVLRFNKHMVKLALRLVCDQVEFQGLFCQGHGPSWLSRMLQISPPLLEGLLDIALGGSAGLAVGLQTLPRRQVL